MIRGVLALLSWSQRLEARTFRPHGLRLLFVLLIFMSLLFAIVSSMAFAAPGLRFFSSICYLNLVLINLAGISYFATAISEEREAQTLDMLKMAGVSPVSVLLGKSTSRLIGAVMLLLVQFPFTLLAITLGGVTLEQIVAAYVALAAFLILLANSALFCSVCCRTSGTAAAMTGLLMLCFFLMGPLAQQSLGLQKVLSNDPTRTMVLERITALADRSSILPRLDEILTTGFAGTPFDSQFSSNILAGLGFFLAAWLIFEPATRESSHPQRAVPDRGRRRKLRSSIRCWQSAVVWKELYFLAGGIRFQIIKFILYGMLFGVIGWSLPGRQPFLSSDFASAAGVTMLAAFVLEACMYAGRIFYDEVRWRSLAPLLMLPMSTSSIARSKTIGCLIALIPSLTWLFAAVCLQPDEFLRTATSSMTWFAILTFATFLHLIALFSLYVNWGALPLAFAVTAFFNTCCPMFSFGFTFMLAGMSGEPRLWTIPAMLFGLFIYWLVILFPIEHEIVARLDHLAGH